jgi:hypothetical protein
MALTVLLLSFGTDDFESSDHDTLQRLGERLQTTTRSADLAGHLGHGRIVVLLFGTNLAGGMIAADRVEQAVAELGLGQVSIGLAVFQDGMKDPSELLETAGPRVARRGGGWRRSGTGVASPATTCRRSPAGSVRAQQRGTAGVVGSTGVRE